MRYLVFMGDDYDVGGGADDFHSAYNTIDEAKTKGEKAFNGDWMHVFDTHTKKIVTWYQSENWAYNNQWVDEGCEPLESEEYKTRKAQGFPMLGNITFYPPIEPFKKER